VSWALLGIGIWALLAACASRDETIPGLLWTKDYDLMAVGLVNITGFNKQVGQTLDWLV